MDLKHQIVQDMKTAMREKDTVRLNTIRLLRAAIQRKEVDSQTELDDAAVLAIIYKMIKQCQDAIIQFAKAGRDDLSNKEKTDIKVLSGYLPSQLEHSELQAIITDVISQSGAKSIQDMGKVIALIKPRIEGRADMAKVSTEVKQLLS